MCPVAHVRGQQVNKVMLKTHHTFGTGCSSASLKKEHIVYRGTAHMILCVVLIGPVYWQESGYMMHKTIQYIEIYFHFCSSKYSNFLKTLDIKSTPSITGIKSDSI